MRRRHYREPGAARLRHTVGDAYPFGVDADRNQLRASGLKRRAGRSCCRT
jgi:hypothetical protein